jgi:hypothetical protein
VTPPRIVTGGLTLVLVVALFSFRDVPMVDLPQHAAQIASWLHWNDPAFRTHELELNFRTPYLLAYPLARLFAPLFGAVGALKLVVAASLVLHVVAFERLVKKLGHDPWLAVLGVPTALGYAFYFGFVSFLVAVPLVVFSIVVALDHAEHPTPKSGLTLATLLSLILLAHGVAVALAFLAVAPLLLRGGGGFVRRTLPLAAPALFGAIWLLPGSSAKPIGGTYWALGFDRLTEILGMLVGIGSADALATATGLLLLGGAALLLGAPSKRPERWLPLFLSMLGIMAFPTMFRGVGPLSPRFVVLLIPGLLLAFEPRRQEAPSRRSAVARTALAVVASGWVLVFLFRLPAFNRETEGLHAIVGEMRPGKSVRPIVFERDSKPFPGVPALLHLPAYYQVKKGGSQGYSFAMYPISVVRYREGVPARMAGGLEWRPEAFDPEREVDHYDYFVVHSASDRSEELFGRAPGVVLEERHGDWWAYRRTDGFSNNHAD